MEKRNTLNPKLDLVFERVVDLPREKIWAAWTRPELIKKWFTPAPWKTVDCKIDLRPGGIFHTVMQSPEGQEFPNAGCFLEIVPNERLVWTNALDPGFRPAKAPSSDSCGGLVITGIIELKTHPQGTHYTATVLHGDEENMKKHAAMGFQEGWGKALDQLIELMKKQ